MGHGLMFLLATAWCIFCFFSCCFSLCLTLRGGVEAGDTQSCLIREHDLKIAPFSNPSAPSSPRAAYFPWHLRWCSSLSTPPPQPKAYDFCASKHPHVLPFHGSFFVGVPNFTINFTHTSFLKAGARRRCHSSSVRKISDQLWFQRIVVPPFIVHKMLSSFLLKLYERTEHWLRNWLLQLTVYVNILFPNHV